MTFREWLLNYRGRDYKVIDIRDDVKHDPTFPDSDSYDVYHSYLKWEKRADKVVMEFFDHAFNCYHLAVFGKPRASDK